MAKEFDLEAELGKGLPAGGQNTDDQDSGDEGGGSPPVVDSADDQGQQLPGRGGEPAPVGAEPPPSLLDRLKGHNLGRDFKDEDEALAYLVERSHQVKQLEPWAQAGQQYDQLRRTPEFQEFVDWRKNKGQPQQGGQQQQQPSQPQAPAAKKWEAPQFDRRWMQFLKEDESGTIVAVPGADPTLPQKYREYVNFREETIHKLISDPVAFFDELMGDRHKSQEEKLIERSREIAREEYRTAAQQFSFENKINSALQEIDEWAYYRNPITGDLVRDGVGQFTLTPEGQQYFEAVQRLHPDTDPMVKHEAALAMIGRSRTGEGNKPAPKTPAQRNQDRKDAYTNGGRLPGGAGFQGASRGGSTATGPLHPDPQVNEQSLEKSMLAALGVR